ncbi:RNA polymerase II-associated [Glomus cerebriforme]|uniref:RNA polymerase II-associated n=1 Tax=Glomus cerebriforme TaxID=658196 RepID=A0A397TC54_9GLOM|nr:RNA polymerase II-associated [Glomus cerebriforme]
MSSSKSKNKNRADFNYICSLKYRHIPPTPEHLPLDLSWNVDLNYLTGPDSFFESFQSSRLPLISDYDLGMKTELSDYPGLFLGDESSLNPRRETTSFDINDQALLCVGKDPVTITQDSPRLKRLSRNEPKEWLRRTQYLDSEAVYKTNKTTTMESRMAALKANSDLVDQSHEEQIKAIDKTFEKANDPEFLSTLKHPTNPSLKVKEIIPVFPEFQESLRGQNKFDRDPWEGYEIEEDEDNGEEKELRMSKAIIIPGEDRHGKNLFRLYVPNVESAKRLVKIKSFEDTKNESYQFKWVRDYNIDSDTVMENQDLLFVEQNPTDGKSEKIFSYSELYVASVLKRRRDTSERIQMPELQGGSTYLNVEYVLNNEKKTPEKLDSDNDNNDDYDMKELGKDNDKNSDITGKRNRNIDLFDDDDIDDWPNEPPSRKIKVNDEKEELFDEDVGSDHTIDGD